MLFAVLLYQAGGFALQYLSEGNTVAIDPETEETVVVKIPINLPYQTDWVSSEEVEGSVRQGDEIVYIDRAYSERSGMQVVRAIGGRAPLHLTSVGKLFLASDDPNQVRAYVTRTGLAGHTRNSITELGKLDAELNQVRKLGHARDNEELELGVSCVAAEIYDDSGKLVAGLSISSPTDRIQADWLKLLQDTALQISKGMGYKPKISDPHS